MHQYTQKNIMLWKKKVIVKKIKKLKKKLFLEKSCSLLNLDYDKNILKTFNIF